MFYTPPSLFDPPTYPRKKLPLAGSPPEQAQSQPQPEPKARVPYRPTEQASPRPPGNTIPLIFRALAHPSLRRPNAAAAAYSDAFPALRSQTQPASAPAPFQSPEQPPQTPPSSSAATQSTEENLKAAAPESTYRDQSLTASTAPGQQLSSKPTVATPQSPSQPPSTPAPAHSPAQPPQTPSTPSPAPQSTEEAPKVSAALKEAAAPQSPNTPAPPAPQSPSPSPTPPAPSQPPAAPPQTPPAATPAPQRTEEMDPKAVDAVNKAAAQEEAADALRKQRAPRRAMLESAGLGGVATSLEALEDEAQARHAELEKKFPQHGPEYQAGMKALLQHIQQQRAQIHARADQLPEIAARIYQQWGKGVAGSWTTGQALRENDRDSPGAPLSQSHLDALNQEAARNGIDPKDLRHHLEMQRVTDWSRGDTSAAVRYGPGGSIWVNPDRYLDENAYRQAVEKSGGSEAEKAAAMSRFPELQQRAAKAQLDTLRTLGVYNQWEASQPEGMSDAEKLAKFRQEHSGIFSSGAWKVRMHQALLGVASGVVGLAKSAVGAYQAATRSPGALDLYEKLSRDASSISSSSAALPTGQLLHMGTSMVVSSAPSLGVGGLVSLTLKTGGAAFGLRTAAQVAQAAQTWGLRGTAATAGLQTFGGMYGDAVQGYMNLGDSEATALNKAFIPALAGAASTYLLTAAGGTQGIEALLRQPAFKENFRQWFKAVAAGSVKEGLREEAPDQLIQGIIERYTSNPDKPWKDIIEETLQAGIGGALLGGGVEATTTSIAPSGTNQDQPQPTVPSNTTPAAQDGSGQPKPATTDGGQQTQTPPAAADLKEVGEVLDNIQRLKDKAKDGPLNLDEQRELDHNEKVLAHTRVKNLEKEQQVIRNLPQPRELDPVKAKALEEARAVLKRPVPGGPSAPPPEASIPDTTTNKPDDTRPSNAPPPGMEPSPQSSSSGSRLQFSQGGENPKPTADSDIVDAHRLLSQEEDSFQLGKSKPDTSAKPLTDSLKELAKAYSQKGKELRVTKTSSLVPGSVISWYQVSTPKGDAYFWVDPESKTLALDTATLNSDSAKGGGGSNIYQLAQTFAKQNGLTFLPDKTVSAKAQRRRISQMISSVFRHGTTDHLNGNATFKDAASETIRTEVPGWKPGDHDHNTALLLRMELDHTMDQASQIDKVSKDKDLVERINQLTHDPKTNTIIDGRTGTALTQRALQSLVDRLEPGESGIGATTLLRSIVTRSALQRHDASGRVRPLRESGGGHPGGQEPRISDGDLVSVARGLYYSRPSGSAGGLPPRRMGDALSGRPGGIASAVAGVSEHLKNQAPGLLHDNTHVFHSVEDLLNSDYAKQHPFSKEDLAGLQNAEGFHDPKTGHSVVIAGNVELRPGETPQDALTRVILHERVGHDGLQSLLGSKDSQAQKHWEGLTQRIPQAELDAIASQQGYQHLKDNPTALAHEWLARQAEKSPHLLKKPGLLRDMWETFKAQLRKMSNNWKDTDESHLDTHLHELLRHSRKAALRTPSASQSVSART